MPNQLNEALLDALYLALPYVEDAEDDPAFKPGVVKKATATIRAAIANAEAAAHVRALPLTHHTMSAVTFDVLADFPDTPEGRNAANALMMANPVACLLDVSGGRIILADKHHSGVLQVAA